MRSWPLPLSFKPIPRIAPMGRRRRRASATAFRDVRGRLLPGIVQAEYVEARRLYDASSWAPAATAFQRVSALAADPDLAEAQVAALADVKMLAEGFAKLAEAAVAPPPPAQAAEPVAGLAAPSAASRLRSHL